MLIVELNTMWNCLIFLSLILGRFFFYFHWDEIVMVYVFLSSIQVHEDDINEKKIDLHVKKYMQKVKFAIWSKL